MSKENSPRYRDGLADGAADSARASACPPVPILGPRPPSVAYPIMYLTGYHDAYEPIPCTGCANCRPEGKQS